MKLQYQFLCVVLTLLLSSSHVNAHPGRTKADGGHTCRTNCSKWGLSTGQYHYHGKLPRRPSTSTSSSRRSSSSYNDLKSALKISPSKYKRKDWPHWIDEDNDCQNTRAEILLRDNTGTIKFKRNKPCNVSWGQWVCPYTGKTFYKASDVDIDHIVPLKHAHMKGGGDWSRDKKRAFANDPDNLLAVDDATNQEKGYKGPVKWNPPRKEYWKTYAQKWLHIKRKYGLKISDLEMSQLQKMLNTN